jgi:hypothetical protein
MRMAATDAPLLPTKGGPVIRRHARHVMTIERAAAQFLAMPPTGRGSRNLARLPENAVAMAPETAKVNQQAVDQQTAGSQGWNLESAAPEKTKGFREWKNVRRPFSTAS